MFEREQVMHINEACSHIYRSRFTKHGGRRGCHECGVVEVVVSGSTPNRYAIDWPEGW